MDKRRIECKKRTRLRYKGFQIREISIDEIQKKKKQREKESVERKKKWRKDH